MKNKGIINIFKGRNLRLKKISLFVYSKNFYIFVTVI